MPMEPASSPSPHSTAEAGAPVLRDQETRWNQRKKRLVAFEVLLHAVRQPAQSREEPHWASWEPRRPYRVQVQRCLQSELGFCHLKPKNVLGPETHFQSRACKEIWQSSFQEHQRWQGLPISGLSLSSFADRQ